MRTMPIPGQSAWHVTAGPLITAAVGAILLLINHYLIGLPTATGLTFLAVLYATYLGGTGAGLISAVILFGYALVFLSDPGHLFSFGQQNAMRLGALCALTPCMILLVGTLRARAARALQLEQASRQEAESSNRELLTLRAALDQVEDGIVLLDRDLRAQFINRAFRNIWRLPDEKADRKPSFVGLVQHGLNMRVEDIRHGTLEEYAAERAERVRAGDETTRDLRLKDGKVYRFRSKALPDGGAMLSYTDVTDLVQHADQLQELATIDGLTGIYNRRHFMNLAESEWGRFRRYDRRLSLLLIDIDHFKAVNDRYGHDAGDRVLAIVARICGDGKRGADTLARLGGEEFALLLPETDIAGAVQLAEQLRQAIASRPVFGGPQAVAVTVSIGATEANGNTPDIAALIKRADDALYEAKRKGRDCVIACGGLPAATEKPRWRPALAS